MTTLLEAMPPLTRSPSGDRVADGPPLSSAGRGAALRAAKRLPGACAVLTLHSEQSIVAITSQFLAIASLEPLYLFARLGGELSKPFPAAVGLLTVSVLAAGQGDMAHRFADGVVLGDGDFLAAEPWRFRGRRLPHLSEATASFDCEIDSTIRVGAGLNLILRVLNGEPGPNLSALVSWCGAYVHLESPRARCDSV